MALLDCRPDFPRQHHGNKWSRYAVSICDALLGKSERAISFDEKNSFRGEFAVVFLTGSPSQIAQGVVRGVIVLMKGFHSIWAWAYESFKHQFMHVVTRPSSEHDREAHVFCLTGAFHMPECQPTPFIAQPPAVVSTRPNRSVVADTVSGAAENVFVDSHSRLYPCVNSRSEI